MTRVIKRGDEYIVMRRTTGRCRNHAKSSKRYAGQVNHEFREWYLAKPILNFGSVTFPKELAGKRVVFKVHIKKRGKK